MSDADLTVVSAEDAQGRVLSGVGTTVEALEKTMERHAPPAEPSEPAATTSEPVTATEPVKEPRGRRRIDALTGEREAEKRAREKAEQELSETKRERDELKAKLAAPPAVTAPATQPQAQPAAKLTAETRPKPKEDEVGAKYQTYGDYVEDLADWKAEQRLSAIDFDAQIRSRIEADRASRSQADRESQMATRARKVYPDFDAVLTSATHLQGPDWPQATIDAVWSLPEPERVIYDAAKDPALATKLRTGNPVQVGMELARYLTAPAVAPQASTAGPRSVVPAPYQPVGSGSKTTSPPSAELVKGGYDFDKSGYREKRAAERGVRRMK